MEKLQHLAGKIEELKDKLSDGEYKDYQFAEYNNFWDENSSEVKASCQKMYNPD